MLTLSVRLASSSTTHFGVSGYRYRIHDGDRVRVDAWCPGERADVRRVARDIAAELGANDEAEVEIDPLDRLPNEPGYDPSTEGLT